MFTADTEQKRRVGMGNIVVTALLRGGMYSLMAVGLSLVYGVMNAANFAHGEQYMLGTYMGYFFYSYLGLNPILAMFMSMVGGFLVGAATEVILFSPLRKRSGKNWIMNTFLLTLGLSLILKNGMKILFGNSYRGITSYFKGTVTILGVAVSYDRLFSFVIAAVIITIMMLFLNKTKFGRAIRAVSMDATGAQLVGIKLRKVYIVTFGLSCSFAALAGAALLSLTPAYPSNGTQVLYASWVVLILVGMGNVGGSIVGGILVGLLETICIQFIGAAWQDVFSLTFVVLILLVKPNGLFGKGVKSAVE